MPERCRSLRYEPYRREIHIGTRAALALAGIAARTTGFLALTFRPIHRTRSATRQVFGACWIAVSIWGRSRHLTGYLIRKSSFLSLVPFISSRIQVGSMPLPVHFTLLFFLD